MDLRNPGARARPFRYFGYAGLLLLSVLLAVEAGAADGYWTLAGFSVVWLVFVEFVRRKLLDSPWIALGTHVFECLVLGLLMTWCVFPLWPMASVGLMLLVGAGAQGGLRFLLPGTAALCLGVFSLGGTHPARLAPASPLVTMSSVVLLYLFMLGIAMESFRQAQRLHASRLRAVGESLDLEAFNARLGRYLPRPLYRLIEHSPAVRHVPQHQWVCVAFIDVVGFTELVQTRAAEEIVDILDGYLAAIAELVDSQQGVLSKLLGDGVLVYFPETQDRRESVRACLAMCHQLEPMLVAIRQRWHERGLLVDLHTRAGVASGYCAIGDWGGAGRLDYTVIGTPVNLASRLQQEAQVAGALVCDTTAALLDRNKQPRPDQACANQGCDVALGPGEIFFIKGFGVVKAYPLVASALSAKVRAY